MCSAVRTAWRNKYENIRRGSSVFDGRVRQSIDSVSNDLSPAGSSLTTRPQRSPRGLPGEGWDHHESRRVIDCYGGKRGQRRLTLSRHSDAHTWTWGWGGTELSPRSGKTNVWPSVSFFFHPLFSRTHSLALVNPWLPCCTPVQHYDGIWHGLRSSLEKVQNTHAHPPARTLCVYAFIPECVCAGCRGRSNGDTVLLCVRQADKQFASFSGAELGCSWWWSGASM